MAKALYEYYGVDIHASTVRRAPSQHGVSLASGAPDVAQRDPRKAEKLAAIQQAIESDDPYTEVFFVDEADIDLNPRIGFTWSRQGHQAAIATPGQNPKHYVAGALHAHSGRLVWAEHEKKNTTLFMKLLDAVHRLSLIHI